MQSEMSLPGRLIHSCSSDSPWQPHISIRLFKTNVIIWDEIFITQGNNLEVVDRTFCDLPLFTLPIEGVVEICIQDFRQIFLIVRAASKSQIGSACFNHSAL